MSNNNIKSSVSGPLERVLEKVPDAFIHAGYPLLGSVWAMSTKGRSTKEKLDALRKLTDEVKSMDSAAISLRNLMLLCGSLEEEKVTRLEHVTDLLKEIKAMTNTPAAQKRRELAGGMLVH